jgi:putative membrane protein
MRFFRNLLTFVILCGVLAVGMLFAVQNTVAVPLDLLFVQLSERSVSLWVLLAFASGGVVGMLTSLGLVVRLRASLMQANRKLRQAEKASARERVPGMDNTSAEAPTPAALPQQKVD